MRYEVLVAMCSLVCPVALSSDEETDEGAFPPVLMTEPKPIAFFDTAPRGVVRLMREAIREACKRTGGQPVKEYGPGLPPNSLSWLCDGTQLTFLSGVQIDGKRVSDGYICNARMYPGFRYNLPRDLRQQGSCIFAAENVKSGNYEVWLD